ncbi:MAG: phosphatase PAP2 family protein, partial [Solibacillus sp.]
EKKKIQIVWIAAVLLACLIGLSRIAEGRHFATDVIAGWSMGYSWFIVCVVWYESRKDNRQIMNT